MDNGYVCMVCIKLVWAHAQVPLGAVPRPRSSGLRITLAGAVAGLGYSVWALKIYTFIERR
jgi:hypothetical protein